jgi:hypothetical protein
MVILKVILTLKGYKDNPYHYSNLEFGLPQVKFTTRDLIYKNKQ